MIGGDRLEGLRCLCCIVVIVDLWLVSENSLWLKVLKFILGNDFGDMLIILVILCMIGEKLCYGCCVVVG